jgi:hypothetical protein
MDDIGLMEVIQGHKNKPEGGPKEILWQSVAFKAVYIITNIDPSRFIKKTRMHPIWPGDYKGVQYEAYILLTTMEFFNGPQVFRDLHLGGLFPGSHMNLQDQIAFITFCASAYSSQRGKFLCVLTASPDITKLLMTSRNQVWL